MPEPAADLTEFLTLSQPKRRACPIGHALPDLPDADRAALEAALATDQGVITNIAIVHWLKARNITASVGSVVSHRKLTCKCRDA